MNREEAKSILQACRPESADLRDPQVQAALELARHDTELATWWEQQANFHRRVRARMRDIPVPAGLRDQILAGEKKIIRPVWQRPELLLLAASVVLALVVTALWAPAPGGDDQPSFATFRARMVGFALRVYRMDIETDDPKQVQQFLRSKGAPADYALAPGLEQTPVKGGASLTWHGNPVSMVCFDLTNRTTLYMFVVDADAIKRGPPPGPEPQLGQTSGVTTASWSQEGKVYLVAAPVKPAELAPLLP